MGKASVMPVFNKYDNSTIDTKKLQAEKVPLNQLFKYEHNRDKNKRILTSVERSIQWRMKASKKDHEEWGDYLKAVTRQEELVRDYFSLPNYSAVNPLDFLIRDNVDRQRRYPHQAQKIKASVIRFVKKEREAAAAAA